MNEKNEQKPENEQESLVDLEVSDEQADEARAGSGPFQSDWKYVPVR